MDGIKLLTRRPHLPPPHHTHQQRETQAQLMFQRLHQCVHQRCLRKGLHILSSQHLKSNILFHPLRVERRGNTMRRTNGNLLWNTKYYVDPTINDSSIKPQETQKKEILTQNHSHPTMYNVDK